MDSSITPSPPNIANAAEDFVLGIQYGDFDNEITTSSDYGRGLIKSNCKLKGAHCWLARDDDKNGYIQVNLRNGFKIIFKNIQNLRKLII